MSAAPTPAQVFATLSAGISAGAWAGLHRLYAEDSLVEMPFAKPAPVRLRGREAVRRHFEANAAGAITLRARDVRVHETADPEVIVVEYDYDGRVADRVFRAANVQVLRVRDGLIVRRAATTIMWVWRRPSGADLSKSRCAVRIGGKNHPWRTP